MASIQIPVGEPRSANTVGTASSDGPFPIGFPFFDTPSMVVVTWDGTVATTLDEGTDYSIYGTSVTDDLIGVGEIDVNDGYSGGNIETAVALQNETIIAWRETPQKRTTDFPTGGGFNIAALNLELDRHMAIIQEIKAQLDRAVRLSMVSNTLGDIDPGDSGVIIINNGTITTTPADDLSGDINYGGSHYGGTVANADYYGGTHYNTDNDVAHYYGGVEYGGTTYGGTVVEYGGQDYGGGVYGGDVDLFGGILYGGAHTLLSYGGDETFFGSSFYGGGFYGGTNTINDFPAGGDTGDVLVKASPTDYDVTWGSAGRETSNTIGAAAATTINHGWNVDDIIVTVREAANGGRIVYPEITFPDDNNVIITFAVAPTAGQYQYFLRSENI